jgi:hypothetical protein
VTLTAVRSLSVTDVSLSPASTPFALGATTPAWSSGTPVSLQAGDTFSVPVTFSPTVVGPVASTLTVVTDSGSYSVSLEGFGKYDTAYPTVSATILSFGGVATGQQATAGFSLTNAGGTPLTITHVATPAAPFSIVSGTLPPDGTVLAPGQSWPTISVRFSPTALGTVVGDIDVATSSTIEDDAVAGGHIHVALSGTGATLPALSLPRTSVDLGPVPSGQAALASFTVSNTGGTPLTLTLSKPPVATGSGFTVVTDIAEGTTVQPGQSVTGTVRFSSTVAGRHTDVWKINGNDPSGSLRTVTFVATVVAPASLTSPAADAVGWKVTTPDATVDAAADAVDLTSATAGFQSGTVASTRPLRSSYLHVAFDLTTGGGSTIGADGTTLMLLDAAHPERVGTRGDPGAGLGWAGLGGTAVGFLSFDPATQLGTNAIGVADQVRPATADQPSRTPIWSAYRTDGLPPLRGAVTPVTRHVDVTVADGLLRVDLDGVPVLTAPVTLTKNVLVGFSAADGSFYDLHRISHVSVVGVPQDDVPPPVPTVSIARTTLTPTWLTTFTSKDQGLGTSSYDVQYARGLFSAAPGPYSTVLSASTSTRFGGTASRGYRYCVKVRARDLSQNVSGWSPATCTTVPLWWKQLTRAGSWRATVDSRVYSGSYVRPVSVGSTLSLSRGVGRAVVLVVTKIPGGGTITVRVGSGKIWTVSLAASKRTNNVVVVVPTGTIGTRTIVVRAVKLGTGIWVSGLGVTP